MTATKPAAGPSWGWALPATITVGAVPKTQVMAPKVNAMPSEPMIRSGLRPSRSTSAIATRVAIMLVTEVMTVMAKASSCVKPTACQSVAGIVEDDIDADEFLEYRQQDTGPHDGVKAKS